MVVLRWSRVFSRVQATQEVSNMVVPSWNHVFSRVQAAQKEVSNIVVPSWNHMFSRAQVVQGGIEHGGPELEPRVFTCPGHTGGYLTWWSCAGTTCFHVFRPSRGVSNMVVPRWNHVFSRVQATQEVSNMMVPSWNHVFSRVQAAQKRVSNIVAPSWHHVFSRAQVVQRGYLT